jgi:hypothetical protein
MVQNGIFYNNLVYFSVSWYIFAVIWYIWWSFGIIFPFLVCCAKKNPAMLMNGLTK